MDTRTSTLRSFRPEVGRFWIRRAFREWPGSKRRWIDLAGGSIWRGGGEVSIPRAVDVEAEGGLLYLPPVDGENAASRDALAAELVQRGVPLLIQVGAGEPFPVVPSQVGAVVVDLLDVLLARRFDALETVPPGAVVVWPLVAGFGDDEALWEDGCRRLGAAGAACVQAMVPELSPDLRRELAADGDDDALYSRVFHARAASERRFAAVARQHGLEFFFQRRSSGGDRRARNAALAELLALGAELWIRLGRSEAQAQELFRASRWVEETPIDVRALAAERNLEIVEALRAPAVAEIVTQWAAAGASSSVESWLDQYATPPSG